MKMYYMKLLFLTSVIMSLSTMQVSGEITFEQMHKQETDKDSFQPGWLAERIKIGDLQGFKKELVWDSKAVASAENAEKEGGGDTLLKIAADARYAAPEADTKKYDAIIYLLLKQKGIDKRQWNNSQYSTVKTAKIHNGLFTHEVEFSKSGREEKRLIRLPRIEDIKTR